MPHERRHAGLLASDDPARLDFAVIYGFLSTCYWCEGIPAQTLRRALEHSLCVGVYDEWTGGQIGFGRVITDRATYAYLADVFVLEAHRGRGAATLLMQTLDSHPNLAGLRRWMLMTRDAHGLYARFGFTPLPDPGRAMQRHNPDVYRGDGPPISSC